MSVGSEQLAQAGQTAAAHIEKKWGGPSRTAPLVSNAIAAGVPARVLLNNPRRMLYSIFNVGTSNAYWGLSSADAITGAVLISPLGGSLVATIDEDGEAVTYEVWVYSVNVATIYVQETFRK